MVFLCQLPEQQLFQRSRWFLWRLGRSLGEDSTLYHQVVSVLQGSSAPTPEDMDKVEDDLLKKISVLILIYANKITAGGPDIINIDYLLEQ